MQGHIRTLSVHKGLLHITKIKKMNNHYICNRVVERCGVDLALLGEVI